MKKGGDARFGIEGDNAEQLKSEYCRAVSFTETPLIEIHSYASHLYKASNYNLRLVQKQLGYSSIKVTEIYADVFKPDLDKPLGRLYS